MRNRLLVAFVGLLTVTIAGQTLSAQTVGPRVKTAQETFDFGVVPQDAHVSHVFWLRNTGDQELQIEKLQPNCGCTQVPLDDKNVAPGDSTRVELIFSTGNFHGHVTKFAQIISNSTGRAPALEFHADVHPDSLPTGPIAVVPRAISLDEMRPDKTDKGYRLVVTLKNTTDHAIRVTSVDLPDRMVTVRPFDLNIAGLGEYKFIISFDDDLPGAEFYRSITFTTTDESQPRVSIPIFKTKRWNN